jgi:hypothetical protein
MKFNNREIDYLDPFIPIGPRELEALIHHGDVYKYGREEYFVHSGHIPRQAIIPLDGRVKISLGEIDEFVPVNSMVAHTYVHECTPCPYSIIIYPAARILAVDRFTLNEVLRDGLLGLSKSQPVSMA